MTQIIFCSSALISAESEGGPLWMEEHAADAQMWCHSDAPSQEDKPPASTHMDFLMIFNPQAGNALWADQRASFPFI